MTIEAGNNLTIEVNQSSEKGTQWQVRLLKNILGFKRQISSDWFLDGAQAKRFAEELAQDLRSDGEGMRLLKHRPPGWTLVRPAH